MNTIADKIFIANIPHQGKTLTFQHPVFGDCERVIDKLDSAGLKRPLSCEVASLVHYAIQNPTGEAESRILAILRTNWLWEFTGNLYLHENPEKEIRSGVIIQDNPTFYHGDLYFDEESITQKLKDGDPSVRFVPFGYKIGVQSPKELSKNAYIIGRYGEEGAEKLAEIAAKYKENPRVWSFDSIRDSKLIMPSLSDHGFDKGLQIGGSYWNLPDAGHAFGIVPEVK